MRRHDKDSDKYMKTDAKTEQRKYKNKEKKGNDSEKSCYYAKDCKSLKPTMLLVLICLFVQRKTAFENSLLFY